MEDQPTIHRTDLDYMRMALRQAERAYDAGEVPIGAIIVLDGLVVAKAYNQVEMLKDATAHAEILAITQASAAIKDWRLQSATLYVTKEPCAMCSGALVNTKMGRVVFGLHDPRSGGCGGALDITGHEGMLFNVSVTGGILEDESRELIQRFFKMRRQEKKTKGNDPREPDSEPPENMTITY